MKDESVVELLGGYNSGTWEKQRRSVFLTVTLSVVAVKQLGLYRIEVRNLSYLIEEKSHTLLKYNLSVIVSDEFSHFSSD